MTTLTLDKMHELYRQGKVGRNAMYILLSDTRKSILQHIDMVGKATASDIAYSMYIDTSYASNELLELVRLDFLEREIKHGVFVYWSKVNE